MLCHLDEQPPLEVAAALGMSPATVRVHLFRALRKLREGAGRPAMTRPFAAHLDDDTLRLLALDPRRGRRRRRPRTWRPAPRCRPRARPPARDARRRCAADADAADRRGLLGRRPGPPAARDPRPHRAAATARPGCCAFPGHDRPAGAARRSPLAGRRRRGRPGPGPARRPAAAPAGDAPHGATGRRPPGPSRPGAPRRATGDWRIEDTLLSEVEAALDPDAASGAPRPRRADARALRDPVAARVPSLIFKKGLDLKREVAGAAGRELPQRRSSPRSRPTTTATRRAGSPCTWPASSASATASTAPSTTPTRRGCKFPDRRVFLTGEIIHNPHVNDRLRGQGIRFLSDAGESCDRPHRRRRRDPAGLRRHRRGAARGSTPSAARWSTPPAGRC